MGQLKRLVNFGRAVVQRFYEDHCLMRASALAYSSLLSLVPLLAVMFAVLKGLGVQRRLEPLLLSRLSLHAETTESIIGYIDRTNVGTLGALGAAFLLVTIIGVLGAIEASFNQIWRVRRNRSRWRQVADFLGVTLLTPFLLLAATAITSSLQSQQVVRWLLDSNLIGDAMMHGLRLLPVGFNILAIALLYAIVPNRRPSWPALLVGAIVAGIAWDSLQVLYVRLQIGVANYSAIYGALSQLPGLLVWLYVSWTVILAGAEIAAVFEFGADSILRFPAVVEPRVVALHLLTCCADAFAKGAPVVSTRLIARELHVAPESVDEIVGDLVDWGWIVVAADDRRSVHLAYAASTIGLARLSQLATGLFVPAGCDPRAARLLAKQGRRADECWQGVSLADVLSA